MEKTENKIKNGHNNNDENSNIDKITQDFHSSTTKKKTQLLSFRGWMTSNFLESTSRGGVDHFMPIFAQLLGAGSSQIGFMTGLFSLVSIFQLLWINLSLRIRRSKLFVILGWVVTFCLFIPISVLRKGYFLFLLILRTIQGFFYSASIPTQASLVAEHISQKDRARKVGTLNWLSLGGALTGTILSGFIVSLFSEVLMIELSITFTFLFIYTFIIGLLAAIIFHFSVPDYKGFYERDSSLTIYQEILFPDSPSKLSNSQKLKRYFKKFPNFWRFCLFSGIFYFAVNLAAPFFIIFNIEVYHLSFFIASLFISISTISQVILGVLFASIGILDKIGRKIPLLIGVILVSLGTFGVDFPYYFGISIFEWSVITWTIMGIGWGIFNASLSVFLLDIVHPQYRMQLIGIYNTINGVTMFLGPILGGIIIDVLNNIAIVFSLRAFIILLSFFALITVKEPEIPGILTHPIKYFFVKHFRFAFDRGAEITVTPTKIQKINSQNWLKTNKKELNSK